MDHTKNIIMALFVIAVLTICLGGLFAFKEHMAHYKENQRCKSYTKLFDGEAYELVGYGTTAKCFVFKDKKWYDIYTLRNEGME